MSVGTHSETAFANLMASWQSGLWTDTYSSRAGWHHNTKEFDGDTGFVYMYQRWYIPETGTFASKAPYPPMMEHGYGAFGSNPILFVDTDGRDVIIFTDKAFGIPNLHAGLVFEDDETGKCCRYDWSITGLAKGQYKSLDAALGSEGTVKGREDTTPEDDETLMRIIENTGSALPYNPANWNCYHWSYFYFELSKLIKYRPPPPSSALPPRPVYGPYPD